MSRAFVLLIWLKNVAGWRALWQSGRGSPVALVGWLWILAILLASAVGWALAVWRSVTLGRDGLVMFWLKAVVRQAALVAPLPLLLFVLLTGILAAFEKPFRFSPTEVDFLCAGPFRRRQLVNFKLGDAFYSMVVISFLLAAPAGTAISGIVPVFVGSLLLFVFLHLFGVVAGMLGTMLGLHNWRGRSRLAITLVFLFAVLAILWIRFGTIVENPLKAYRQFEQPLAWRVASSPLRWFVEATVAQRLWPDLVAWSSLCLVVDGLLFVTVHALDARLERRAEPDLVRVDDAEAVLPARRREPWSLPLLSRCGGLAPIAWRQGMNAVRMPQLLFLAFMLYGLSLFFLFKLALGSEEILFMPAMGGHREINPAGAWLCAAFTFVLWMMLAPMLPFDFRRDMGQIDVLKAIPIQPIVLTAGQLFVPAVIAALMLWASMAFVAIALRSVPEGLWAAAAFVPQISVTIAAIENLPVLWFPVRHRPGTKPDPYELIGQVLIHPLIRLAAYLAVIVPTLVAAAVAYFLLGQRIDAALVAAWLTLAAGASSLVVIVAHAFDRFDVMRDVAAEH